MNKQNRRDMQTDKMFFFTPSNANYSKTFFELQLNNLLINLFYIARTFLIQIKVPGLNANIWLWKKR
jgi:hypothetical protein